MLLKVPDTDAMAELLAHAHTVREQWDTVAELKRRLAIQDYDRIAEAWSELTREQQQALWLAPSKGGVFTTQERKMLHSDEMATALRAYIAHMEVTQ